MWPRRPKGRTTVVPNTATGASGEASCARQIVIGRTATAVLRRVTIQVYYSVRCDGDSFAGASGLACGRENLRDDQVVFERRKTGGLEFAANHGHQIRHRILFI